MRDQLGKLLLPPFQWLCGRNGGHRYSVLLWAADNEQTFVADPLSQCKYCGKKMSAKRYDSAMAELNQYEEEDVW